MHRIWGATLAIIAFILCIEGFQYPANGAAQGSGSIITSRGSIVSVDCDGGSFVLKSQTGSQVFIASASVVIFAATERVSGICNLRHFIGSLATVWATTLGTQAIAARIDVSVPNTQGGISGGQGGEGVSAGVDNDPPANGSGSGGTGSTGGTGNSGTGSSGTGSSGGKGTGGTGSSGGTGTGGAGSSGTGPNGGTGTGGTGSSGGTGSNGGTGTGGTGSSGGTGSNGGTGTGGTGSSGGTGSNGGTGTGGTGSSGNGSHGHGEGGASGHPDNNSNGQGFHERK
jgi:hypothetical protein